MSYHPLALDSPSLPGIPVLSRPAALQHAAHERRTMTEPSRTTAQRRISILFLPPSQPAALPTPRSQALTSASSPPRSTSSSAASPPPATAALTPPAHHRRRSSSSSRPLRPHRQPSQSGRLPTGASVGEHREQSDGSDDAFDAAGDADPFASYLTHHAPAGAGHASKASMGGGLLGFTASLAMRRVAMIAKILSSLKRCPLVNPTHVIPRSRPAATPQPSRQSPSYSGLTASGYPSTFLPHVQLLAHHPSLTVLPYPAGSVLVQQSSQPSLVQLLVSGAVRVVRDGVELAHVGRGAVVGAEACLFGTEGYRRWRRTLWKKRLRQRRQDEAAGIDKRRPHTAQELSEAERDKAMDEDEKELAFADELHKGKKRRKLKAAQYCTVQCLTPCECVVLPASVLRGYLESDQGLKRHAYQWLMEGQWVRRRQWREGEKRLHRVWGAGGLRVDAEDRTAVNARDAADLAALTGNDEIEVEAGALERGVLGSSGFLYHNVVQPADDSDEERKSHATHAQNAAIDHPLFARSDDGVSDRRLRLHASDRREGQQQQKAEMRAAREKEDKAKKVRKIIGAMERKRRDSKQQRAAASAEDDDEEEDEDEDDYEEDEDDEDTDGDPALLDTRYAAAVAAAVAQSKRGTGRDRKGSKLTTPKFKLSRRLKQDEVRAVDDKLLNRAAIKGILGASHRREATRAQVDAALLFSTPHTAARRVVGREDGESEADWERRVELQAQEMRLWWKRADEEKVQRQLSSPYVDINFLRPATAPASSEPTQQPGEKLSVEGPLRTLASSVYTKRKEVISETAARTRQREAEEVANRAIDEFQTDRGRARAGKSKPPSAAATAATARSLSCTPVPPLSARMLAEAEQRWDRPDREVRQMVEWDLSSRIVAPEEEEEKVQEMLERVLDVDEEDWSSDDDPADSLGPLHSADMDDELAIEAERNKGAEAPILLSPQSKATTPFAALPLKPFFFPLPPSSVRDHHTTPRQAQSARPSTAPATLATQPPPHFTFSPQPPQLGCATARPAAGAGLAGARVRQLVAARRVRAEAAVGTGVGSAMRGVDNKGLPWETRLALLTQASGMEVAEAERRQDVRDLKNDRDRIAAAMKAPTRTSRVAVSFVTHGGVRVIQGSHGERPLSRASDSRGVMRRYAQSLSQALNDTA